MNHFSIVWLHLCQPHQNLHWNLHWYLHWNLHWNFILIFIEISIEISLKSSPLVSSLLHWNLQESWFRYLTFLAVFPDKIPNLDGFPSWGKKSKSHGNHKIPLNILLKSLRYLHFFWYLFLSLWLVY